MLPPLTVTGINSSRRVFIVWPCGHVVNKKLNQLSLHGISTVENSPIYWKMPNKLGCNNVYQKICLFLAIDILSYFCHQHWTWHSDFLNRKLQSRFPKIVRSVAAIFFFLNNFLLGNGSAIHGSKNLNATFNVGGKSNWVRQMGHEVRKIFILITLGGTDGWTHLDCAAESESKLAP